MINPDGSFSFKNTSLSSLKMSKLGFLVGSRFVGLLHGSASVSFPIGDVEMVMIRAFPGRLL